MPEAALDEALFSILTADVGVSALVGTRVYPGVAEPGAALPYIVYEQTDDSPVQALDRATGLRTGGYALDCFGETRAQARAVRKAAEAALAAYQGASPGGTYDVQGFFPEGGETGVELPSAGDELPVHRATLNVGVGYGET